MTIACEASVSVVNFDVLAARKLGREHKKKEDAGGEESSFSPLPLFPFLPWRRQRQWGHQTFAYFNGKKQWLLRALNTSHVLCSTLTYLFGVSYETLTWNDKMWSPVRGYCFFRNFYPALTSSMLRQLFLIYIANDLKQFPYNITNNENFCFGVTFSLLSLSSLPKILNDESDIDDI